METETHNKNIVFTTGDINVYDYSEKSFAIATSYEWYKISSNENIIRNILHNGKYNKFLTTRDGSKFTGWIFSKNSNTLESITEALNTEESKV